MKMDRDTKIGFLHTLLDLHQGERSTVTDAVKFDVGRVNKITDKWNSWDSKGFIPDDIKYSIQRVLIGLTEDKPYNDSDAEVVNMFIQKNKKVSKSIMKYIQWI